MVVARHHGQAAWSSADRRSCCCELPSQGRCRKSNKNEAPAARACISLCARQCYGLQHAINATTGQSHRRVTENCDQGHTRDEHQTYRSKSAAPLTEPTTATNPLVASVTENSSPGSARLASEPRAPLLIGIVTAGCGSAFGKYLNPLVFSVAPGSAARLTTSTRRFSGRTDRRVASAPACRNRP